MVLPISRVNMWKPQHMQKEPIKAKRNGICACRAVREQRAKFVVWFHRISYIGSHSTVQSGLCDLDYESLLLLLPPCTRQISDEPSPSSDLPSTSPTWDKLEMEEKWNKFHTLIDFHLILGRASLHGLWNIRDWIPFCRSMPKFGWPRPVLTLRHVVCVSSLNRISWSFISLRLGGKGK